MSYRECVLEGLLLLRELLRRLRRLSRIGGRRVMPDRDQGVRAPWEKSDK